MTRVKGQFYHLKCAETSGFRQASHARAKRLLPFQITPAAWSTPPSGRMRNLVINIFDCANLVCGRIVWLGEPAKRASQCGRTIIWGLERQSPSVWTGGSILDPNDGKTYRLSATYEPDDTLRARIFIGVPIFGKTEILKRIDMKSLQGLC
jgi:hypothetical protein